MDKNRKRKLAVGSVAALAMAGGGGAIAATQFGSPSAVSGAVVTDAAGQLGIEPSKLSDALKKALEDQIDAAVKAGQLTQAQGDEMKSRIESGDYPLFNLGGPHGGPGHFGHGDDLNAAATYLGLTVAQVQTELQGGKTLAQIATAHGKTVDGLVQALYDAEKTELDAAVTAGRLTQAQEDSILSNLKQRITTLVNGTFPGPRGRPGFGFRGYRSGQAPPCGEFLEPS